MFTSSPDRARAGGPGSTHEATEEVRKTPEQPLGPHTGVNILQWKCMEIEGNNLSVEIILKTPIYDQDFVQNIFFLPHTGQSEHQHQTQGRHEPHADWKYLKYMKIDKS